MTEPHWVVLDHRELPDGRLVVYHWRDAGRRCVDSGRYMALASVVARCSDHLDRAEPCPFEIEWPSRCEHPIVVMRSGRPWCTGCWMYGDDVAAELAAEMGA